MRVLYLASVALLLSAAGCEPPYIPPPATPVEENVSASVHGDVAPKGDVPIATAYRFQLGDIVHGKACSTPGSTYHTAIAGVNVASLSVGELAAIDDAIAKVPKADLFLLTRSRGWLDKDGHWCGEAFGRAVQLETVDVPLDSVHRPAADRQPPPPAAPAPAPATPPPVSPAPVTQ